jgi:hypothetical protein
MNSFKSIECYIRKNFMICTLSASTSGVDASYAVLWISYGLVHRGSIPGWQNVFVFAAAYRALSTEFVP